MRHWPSLPERDRVNRCQRTHAAVFLPLPPSGLLHNPSVSRELPTRALQEVCVPLGETSQDLSCVPAKKHKHCARTLALRTIATKRAFLHQILQAVFFLICVLNDCFGTNAVNPKKRPFVRKLKDSFHASLGFPIAMFVGIIFWILMFVDRELVLPKAIDPYFPWWLNHLMHTMIMVTTVLEMIVAPRQYPKRSRGLTILVSFMLMYLVWIHVIYFKSGFWVYPVMEVLTLPLRIVFIVSLLVVCIVLYFVGETLDNYLWGKKCVAVTESVDPDLKT
ncbi:androgen-induced gene 1 protein-like isoform X1 [Odontomachus brunneus]|uniref:androgen-induced gene 1 protein-like isoform X1 n=1 Tax=Odontomachus brunneus TaxID=486640 RepID=UPI0013F203BE|nr:androgen-induced gene 1 protein-like isoform X1 [Odontomachus brunneus]